jgi:flavin-dependent dehydrogenase
MDKAKDLGTDIVQPCDAQDIIIHNNKIIGIETSKGGFLSDFIIDAAGSTHWFARRYNIKIKKYSPPLYAQYGYVKEACKTCYDIPMLKSNEEGWIWISKVKDNFYQWTRMTFNKKLVLQCWLPDELKELEPIGPVLGADVTWKIAEKPSDAKYFIIGDAAASLDPVSSHGVLKGIMSGIKASQAIVYNTKNNIPFDIISKGYNNWLLKWFLKDVNKLRVLS